MMREELRSLVAAHLADIAEVLPPSRFKLTFVARCIDPDFADKNADIFIGDDRPEDAIATIERLIREGQ